MMRDSGGIIVKIASLFTGRAGRFSRKIGIGGFTLLELWIVIEIIGFLMTIVISNLYRSKKAAKVAMYVQNVKNVQTALTSYYAMELKYPATLNTIWLQFYDGRQVPNIEYIGGTTAGNQGGWNFFNSNSAEIKFNGPTQDEYAIRSTEELLPYARYVYGDVATSAKVIR
jgi:type II secretory pathway pseudopilin PulG